MQHVLPPLPYDYAALEPHVDAQTMRLHHDRHHAAYVDKLNAALETLPELRARNAMWLMLNLNLVPRTIRATVRNVAGGHVNHSLLWQAMSPAGGGTPAGPLADAITRDFGGLGQFREKFSEQAAKHAGPGWIWLVRARMDGGSLRICTTSGHDNPLMQGSFPVLVNDLWEHAYYLKHQDRRDEYLRAWWAVANWEDAGRRFNLFDNSTGQLWEDTNAHAVPAASAA